MEAAFPTLWPLIGRERELEAGAALLRDERAAGVVVAGEAGTGKTRLALELGAASEALGLPTARAVASRAAATVPLGALAPLLPRGETLAGVAGMQRAAEALASLGGRGRSTVVVDDAHLLDDASAALLHQVALARTVFLVVTVRTGESAPDAVVSLWKDGGLERLELEPLSPAATAGLAAQALGGVLEAHAARRLYELSHGNPLYLRELVRSAVERGMLRGEAGVWSLVGDLDLPARLVELVELRLTGLEPEDTAVLEIVAVADTLGLSALELVADPERVERLERRRLLEVAFDGKRRPVRLSHPLYGELLRAAMPRTRALAVGRDLAALLERTGAGRRGDLLRLAAWRLEVGGALDGPLMLEAARQATYADDGPLAQRLARAAVDADVGFDAGLLLGTLLHEAGRPEEAERAFARLDPRSVDDARRAEAAMARSDNLFFCLGREADALAALEDAAEGIASSAPGAAVATNAAWLRLHAGSPAAALAAVDPLLASAAGDVRAGAGIVAATALALSGRTRDALAAADAALAADRPAAYPHVGRHRAFPEIVRAVALLEAGRLDDAAAVAVAGYEESLVGGESFRRAHWTFVLGRVALARGRVRTAMRRFDEAAALQRRLRQPGLLRWNLGGLALAGALAGDGEAAAAALAEADSLVGRPERLYEPLVERGRAWAAVGRSADDAARASLELAVEAALAVEAPVLAAAGLHDLARLGHARDAVARLHALAGETDSALVHAAAEHAAALAEGDAPRLARCAHELRRLGALLAAAEAAAAAGMHAREEREAQAYRLQAARLAARCEGARTPALAAVAGIGRLSPREHEVAALVAGGLTNRAIADRLFISVRTVDKHVEHVLQKLGVPERGAVRDALGPAV